jgi:cob(I)alamin adenosyltransferase
VVKIYTRKGDDGSTSLWYGGRVPKHDARTDAYGTVDEAVSLLGVARALCSDRKHRDLATDILQLQQELFVAGAELATAPEAGDRLEDGVSRITEGMVDAVEVDIDRYMRQVNLPPQFVIPGGTEISAALDVARTVIRRAERRVVALRDEEGLASEVVIRYLNRASDLAYAMARWADEDNPQLFSGRRESTEAKRDGDDG